MIGTILGAVLLAYGFFLCGMIYASMRGRPGRLRVEVGQSTDNGRPVQHVVSARIVDRRGRALHYVRVDLCEDGYEEKLAEAVVDMKHKLRTVEAAARIAGEVESG